MLLAGEVRGADDAGVVAEGGEHDRRGRKSRALTRSRKAARAGRRSTEPVSEIPPVQLTAPMDV
ncbi:hypothetical protein QEV13_08605 [Trueperella pyogenes]|uniref:hypothetical protein n=1 Tax=Trueperella pyogenes TaxID=1661 RepID=UPI0024C0C362|nr:hypothetical protein [Trueperella pyogenes]WHU60690.1 hypothetical protein QEV13_08605 [Trueperella pyogenes]